MSIFIVAIFSTIASVFIGLFPRKVATVRTDNFVTPDEYNCTRERFLGMQIRDYKAICDSLANVVEKKQKFITVCMLETGLNTVLIAVLLLIKFTGV